MPELLFSDMDVGTRVSILARTCAVEVVIFAQAGELVPFHAIEVLLHIAVWDRPVDRLVLGKVVKGTQSGDKTGIRNSDTAGN